MDPVITALVSAISSGLRGPAAGTARNEYAGLKQVLEKKLGTTQTIDAPEVNPKSKELQTRLARDLAEKPNRIT